MTSEQALRYLILGIPRLGAPADSDAIEKAIFEGRKRAAAAREAT